MGVKANKARGLAAEREVAAKVDADWPDFFYMERTGLDGGHDLRGKHAIGEVKAVKAGPEWLKSALAQIDGCDDGRSKFIFIRLSRGPGKPVRWLVLQDFDQVSELVHPLGCNLDDHTGCGRVA